MNQIKLICKDPNKVEQKLQGKEFLLGKYFTLKSNCKRCKKDKKFQKSKRQKILQIQHKLNEQQAKPNSGSNEIPINSNEKMIDEKQQDQNPGKKIVKEDVFSENSVNYEYFLPLHRLWNGYIDDLIGADKNQQSASLKLLRSDFVGAYIQVVYSKVNSYIGQKGIIIKQTLKSFVLIKKPTQTQSQPNKQKLSYVKPIIRLLKNEIIFLVNCGQKSYLVNGNTLTYRPSDRSKHKFKFRMGEKINLDFLGLFNQDDE